MVLLVSQKEILKRTGTKRAILKLLRSEARPIQTKFQISI